MINYSSFEVFWGVKFPTLITIGILKIVLGTIGLKWQEHLISVDKVSLELKVIMVFGHSKEGFLPL